MVMERDILQALEEEEEAELEAQRRAAKLQSAMADRALSSPARTQPPAPPAEFLDAKLWTQEEQAELPLSPPKLNPSIQELTREGSEAQLLREEQRQHERAAEEQVNHEEFGEMAAWLERQNAQIARDREEREQAELQRIEYENQMRESRQVYKYIKCVYFSL